MENEWWKLPGNLKPEVVSWRCLCSLCTGAGECTGACGRIKPWWDGKVRLVSPAEAESGHCNASARDVLDDDAIVRAMAAEDEHRHSSREERVRAMLKAALG